MSEIDKTIEELEQEVLDDLNEAEHGMKKDTSVVKTGGNFDPMKKVEEVDDTGQSLKVMNLKRIMQSQLRKTVLFQ